MPGVVKKANRPSPATFAANATDYIPYNAGKSQLPKEFDRTPAAVLSGFELEKIRKISADGRANERLAELLKREACNGAFRLSVGLHPDFLGVHPLQKEDLHAQSLARVKEWDNTIMGQRRKRLAAKAERMDVQEVHVTNVNTKRSLLTLQGFQKERQKVDEEWNKVKEAERNEIVNRARSMQHFEDPRIKQLTSALQLSNVLQERDSQITALRNQQKTLQTVKNAEEVREKEAQERARRAEHEAILRAKVEAARVAAVQEQQMREHVPPGQKHPAEKLQDEYWAAEAKRRAQEALDETARERQARMEQEIKQKKALDEAKVLQQVVRREQLEHERRLKEENQKFEEMKKLFNLKRAETERQVVKDRQTRSFYASRSVKEQAREKERRTSEYYERNLHAHDGYWEKRDAQERAKHEAAIAEERRFREERNKMVQARKLGEKEEGLSFRHKVEEDADVYLRGLQAEKQAAQKKNDAFKESQREQMLLSKRELEQKHAQELAQDIARRRAVDADDDEFTQYAMKLIQDWQNAGRDIKPLLKVLRQQERQRRGVETVLPPGPSLVNTFSRLGFTQ
ncbi:hypothetical protein BC832DRAFT_537552 [Gaertneriomyces semiglobifer]|nr:hypothetical protein BC832DRAFT_537552 [Gaertneriomyces semiglobifer]